MNLYEETEYTFENSGTIYPILTTIKNQPELDALKSLFKYQHSEFASTARKEINEYDIELRADIRREVAFKNKVDVIEDLICVPHILRNGSISKSKFRDISRALATGGIRELPYVWTGLISVDALVNAEKDIEHAFRKNRHRLSHATFVKATRNSNEHFYNNLYAASIVLCYKLYFNDNRESLEDMCNVFRQVHVTTARENNKLKHNGQNEEDKIGWKEAYTRNNIALIDAHARPVQVLSIKNVVPDGLIEMTMDLRVGWKD